jgi:hypothetical protein
MYETAGNEAVQVWDPARISNLREGQSGAILFALLLPCGDFIEASYVALQGYFYGVGGGCCDAVVRMWKWRVAGIYSNNPDTTGSRCVKYLCWEFVGYKRVFDTAVCGDRPRLSYAYCHTCAAERL